MSMFGCIVLVEVVEFCLVPFKFIMWKQQIEEQQLGFICGSERVTDWVVAHFSIVNILIFETLASMFLTYMIVISGGFFSYLQFATFNIIICTVSYFVAYLFSSRFCHSILNPVLVIAYMLKKQNKISVLTGIVYLFSQFVGTIIGSVIGFYVCSNFTSPSVEYLRVAQDVCSGGVLFFQSAISAFLFIVTVLTAISTDVTFVEVEFHTWIVIPLIYSFTALLSTDTLGPNFFIGLIVPFFGSYFKSNWVLIARSWPIIIGPLVGGVLGTVFFQGLYRRFVFVYKQQLREEEKILQRQEEERQRKLRRQTVLQLV